MQVPGRFVIVGTVPCLLTGNQHDWVVFQPCVMHVTHSALFQSVFIPEDLYRRMYFCLKSLVTLPEPYCAVALNYARQMKMEQNAPGDICSYIKAIKALLVLIWCQTRIKLGCFPFKLVSFSVRCTHLT